MKVFQPINALLKEIVQAIFPGARVQSIPVYVKKNKSAFKK